jgi:hypothetical protein
MRRAGHVARMEEIRKEHNILIGSQGNSVSTVTELRGGRPEFDCRQGAEIFFLFATAFRQPPIKWIPRAFSSGVQRPEREYDPSPPSRTDVNTWRFSSTSP